MRVAAVIFIMVGLGCLFLLQKRHENQVALTQPETTQNTSPRPVSEHNWAKHALDTTREVTSQVSEQRKDDGVRK